MEINILHLYYDLLNLYGENGNIKALKKHLEEMGVRVNIEFLTINDVIDFSRYDFVYIGAGTEKSQKLVLKHLLKYKKDIKNYIESNKFFLATGNSLELFGKFIKTKDTTYKCLNIFDYESYEEDFRMVDQAIFDMPLINEKIIGFQNQGSITREIKNHLFEVVRGVGSYPNSSYEGIHYKNFFGTYLIGPLLVRNPNLVSYMVKELIKSKDSSFKFNKMNLYFETKAYNTFLDFAVKGEKVEDTLSFSNLNGDEKEMLSLLKASLDQNRLEQERIDQSYIKTKLEVLRENNE